MKFHWKPCSGMHSLVWDEAQKLAGKDADFHRRDLWEAIEKGDQTGDIPECELGVQLFSDAEADKFPFDMLDPTKLIPEELVPVRRIGKMTLDRNPDDFFAETEQVAFCVSHVVPGIDFSNDPLLQGRIFSYLDTQLSRLGGPNFHQIPINRPRLPVPQRPARRHAPDEHARRQHVVRAEFARRRLAEGEAGRAGRLRELSRAPRRRQAPRARGVVQGPLLAGDAVLEQPVGRREGAHRRGVLSSSSRKWRGRDPRADVVDQLVNVDAELASRVAAKVGAHRAGRWKRPSEGRRAKTKAGQAKTGKGRRPYRPRRR